MDDTAEPVRRRRPPFVRQRERSDCGPAALLSVLRFWGGDATLTQVRELARTGPRGSSLRDLADAALELGLQARGGRGSYEDLRRERLPCVAHLVLDSGRTHFVTVCSVGEDRVEMVDPAIGRRRLSREQFEGLWRSRSVLLLEPTDDLCRDPSEGWLRWLGGHLLEQRIWLVQSLFLGTVATGISLATAIFVQWLIDRFIPAGDRTMIIATGVLLLLLLVLRSVAGYVRDRFLIRLNRQMSNDVNSEFLARLYRLPLRFFRARGTGDVTARLADGVKIQQGLLHLLGVVVIDGLLVVGSFAVLGWLAPPLAVLASAVLPVLGILSARGAGRIGVRQREALEGYARLESKYVDGLTGMSAVLDHAAQNWMAHAASRLHAAFQSRVEGVGRVRARVTVASELSGGVLVTSALVLGALLVVSGSLQLGELMAGYSLIAGMVPSVDRLVQSGLTFQETAVAAGRLRDVMLSTPETEGRERLPPISRGLGVEGVSLTWPGGAQTFSRVHLEVPVGRVTGLTGPNGAGKTTFVRLLNRTVRPDRGRVLVDGRSVDDFTLRSYRRRVALVPAETHVFAGSLRSNVLLGRGGSAPSSLDRLDALGFASLFARFPDGWDTLVGDGGRTLSSGERQAMGLARALVGNPEVLLVDEGVTSTDDEVSRTLLEILMRHSWRGAVLLVSHDRHVLAHAEHLYVLDDGKIADSGPPDRVFGRPRGAGVGRGARSPPMPGVVRATEETPSTPARSGAPWGFRSRAAGSPNGVSSH